MKPTVYKYNIVARNIIQNILPGLMPGDLLPASNELCRMYDTSEITINKALKILVERGLIKRIQSKGSVLLRQPEGLWEVENTETTTLSVMGINPNAWHFMEAFEKMMDRFCELNPYVSYEVTYVDSAEYSNHLKNNNYDLVLVNTWGMREILTTPELEEKFIPLEKIPGLLLDENVYLENVIKWCRSPRGIICMPVTFSPVFMAVNMDYPGIKELAPEEFSSLDKLLDALRRLRQNELPSFYIPFSLNYWPSFLRMRGAKLFSEDGKRCLLDSPEATKAVSELCDLFLKEKLLVPPLHSRIDSDYYGYRVFKSGNLAAVWESGLALNEDYNFQCSYYALPEAAQQVSHLLVEGIMCSNTENTAIIKDVLNYMQTVGALEMFQKCAGITTQKYFAEIYLRSLETSSRNSRVMLDSLEFAQPIIPVPRQKVCRMIEDNLLLALCGVMTPQQVCTESTERANQMLAKENF